MLINIELKPKNLNKLGAIKMNILYITGYDAWTQISEGRKPSHHLYGVHELIDHYEKRENGSIYGVLKKDTIISSSDGGEVDFYIWPSVKKNIIRHMRFLIKNKNKYDLVYDCLNRGSIWIGILKRLGLFKGRVITMLHHPSYKIALSLSKSDAYMFFNDDYIQIAKRECPKKKDKFYLNEWYPDTNWYNKHTNRKEFNVNNDVFIDNGKTDRDRDLMIKAAETQKIRIDYPGAIDAQEGYARTYKLDLSDYTGMANKLRTHCCIVVPIKKFNKEKIGPLGITSFLDCIALGIPVITSDNTCFAPDVKKYKLGCVYRTGDVDSLMHSLRVIKDDHEFYNQCVKNIEQYSNGRTIEAFNKKLLNIINKVMG